MDRPINDKTPVAMLHWMVTDRQGHGIVIEKTKDKLAVHDNPVGVMTADGMTDLTLYSSCMDQDTGIYYYRNYGNNRINAVDLRKEELEGDSLKIFEYLGKQDICYQN